MKKFARNKTIQELSESCASKGFELDGRAWEKRF